MIDFLSVIKNYNAYKVLKTEKQSGRLSHAYLFITPDGDNLLEYLKVLAKVILCDSEEPCGKCRACKNIESLSATDVLVYPKNGQTVVKEDIIDIIEESYIKPLEFSKKVFLINHGETMNLPSQNKLLKTLEEPPKNVVIIIGATSEFAMLPTIKSRVKTLNLSDISDEDIINALSSDYTDTEKLKSAVYLGDGSIGKALKNYLDPMLKDISDLVLDILINMKSSRNVLTYSNKITALKCDTAEFLSVLDLTMQDLLLLKNNRQDLVKDKNKLEELKRTEGFTLGSILFGLEQIVEAKKKLESNVNATTTVEWLLFKILEGKYKWRK